MTLFLKKFFNKKSFHYHYAKRKLLSLHKEGEDVTLLEATVLFLCKKKPSYCMHYKKAFFVLFKDIHKELSIEFGEDIANENHTDESFYNVLSVRKERLVRDYRRSKRSKNNVKKILDKFKLSSPTFYVSDFQDHILEILEKKNQLEVQHYIGEQLRKYPNKNITIFKNSFRLLKDIYPALALEYGDKVLITEKDTQDTRFIQVLFTRAKRINDIEKLSKYTNLLNSSLAPYYTILSKEKNSLKKIKIKLTTNYNLDIHQELSYYLTKYDKNKSIIYFIFATLYYNYNRTISLEFLDKALKNKKDFFSYQTLFDFYIEKGLLYRAYSSMPSTIDDTTFQTKIHVAKENHALLKKDIPIPKIDTSVKHTSSTLVWYLLYNSLPYHSGGYAIRSHELLCGINSSKNNITIEGVTRLAYPNDIVKKINIAHVQKTEVIEGQSYHRLRSDVHKSNLPYLDYIEEYVNAIISSMPKHKPFVLHAASNFLNGIAAVFAARRLGIKSIYEIRGLWEITSISNHPELIDSDIYKLHKELETQAAFYADRVTTITHALKEEMIKRGVSSEKIVVIPNGVNTSKFKPLPKNNTLQKTLNIQDKVVIGYLGSFVSYEGLDYLVEAIDILIKKDIKNIIVLMVGDGAIYEDIQEKVKKLDISSFFIFTGRVPHKKIKEYYSLVDIAPFPRKGVPVCEMVSPLKPFEAMSMGKAILVSNVSALSEIVQDKKTGLIFQKDNTSDFANSLEELITDEHLRKDLGSKARVWVKEHREWSILSKKLENIYTELKES